MLGAQVCKNCFKKLSSLIKKQNENVINLNIHNNNTYEFFLANEVALKATLSTILNLGHSYLQTL